MSKYGLLDPGTCLPVLESIFNVFDINNTLEFGAGVWSTFSLIRNSKKVTSIENIKEWVQKVEDDYSHKNNLNVIHWTKPMNEYLKEITDNFDLIFIDGDDRIECLRDSFNRSPIIVCHDTHQPKMGWADVDVPENYEQLTYFGCLPYYTTIFSIKDINIKNVLLDINNFTHKNSCIDRNFWTTQTLKEIYYLKSQEQRKRSIKI
tara:strand:+ start:271 stop:885 length:615 start_codon:yes stop_codon:yes gene_type:complete